MEDDNSERHVGGKIYKSKYFSDTNPSPPHLDPDPEEHTCCSKLDQTGSKNCCRQWSRYKHQRIQSQLPRAPNRYLKLENNIILGTSLRLAGQWFREWRKDVLLKKDLRN